MTSRRRVRPEARRRVQALSHMFVGEPAGTFQFDDDAVKSQLLQHGAPGFGVADSGPMAMGRIHSAPDRITNLTKLIC